MAEVRFVSTAREDHNVKIVAEVIFLSKTREDHNAKIVDGSQVCENNRIKSTCKDCDLLGHFAEVARDRVYTTLKNDKEMSSTECLGCNIGRFKKQIEQQFTEGMSWENYGEWYIDHKIPLTYNKPSLEEVGQRLHYTNIQPMWAGENMSKGCRYISD